MVSTTCLLYIGREPYSIRAGRDCHYPETHGSQFWPFIKSAIDVFCLFLFNTNAHDPPQANEIRIPESEAFLKCSLGDSNEQLALRTAK